MVSKADLFTGKIRDIAEELVSFLIAIGHHSDRNEKLTKIMAYLQIYGELSQEQLHRLTGLATGTISSSLTTLCELNLVIRDHPIDSRYHLYRPQSSRISFEYYSFKEILAKLDDADTFFTQCIDRVLKCSTIPANQKRFFTLRIHSYLNYIELQRRTLNQKKNHDYLPELNTLDKIQTSQSSSPLCQELLDIEQKIVQYFLETNLFSENDPLTNRIIAYFLTRGVLTQNELHQLLGFSLSTVSRYLTTLVDFGVITLHPKQYRAPRLYSLINYCDTMQKIILAIDATIFSYESQFQNRLKHLQENSDLHTNLPGSKILVEKLTILLEEITKLHQSSHRLEENFQEYSIRLHI